MGKQWLDGGIRYTQMSGGDGHSVLLRSDGAAVGASMMTGNAAFHLWMLE
jgi:hypothetical protein